MDFVCVEEYNYAVKGIFNVCLTVLLWNKYYFFYGKYMEYIMEQESRFSVLKLSEKYFVNEFLYHRGAFLCYIPRNGYFSDRLLNYLEIDVTLHTVLIS